MAEVTVLKDRKTNQDLYPVTSVNCITDYDVVFNDEWQSQRIAKIESELKIHSIKPDNKLIQFIIDQRYVNNLSDPDDMVSDNFLIDVNGNRVHISDNGKNGDPRLNFLSWLREHTHAYVSKCTSDGKLRLKQLDDYNRKRFNDGTDAFDYITNVDGEYDVFLKFDVDIYYKTEPWYPEDSEEKDIDYVLVSIGSSIPAGEDASYWTKWSKYKLIGVYEACLCRNGLHSLSGQRPANSITQINAIAKAKERGDRFVIADYAMTKLFAFLFYGYYSTLDCQKTCGYGTKIEYKNASNGTSYSPKITGLTDDLAMLDTDSTTGNGAANPDNDQIINGYGSDIRSINFWGLENCWGDLSEWISDLKVMQAANTNSSAALNPNNFIADYLEKYPNSPVIVTKIDGTAITYTSRSSFITDYPTPESRFIVILDKTTIVRAIDVNSTANIQGTIGKMIFGKHSDIIIKKLGNNNTGFCDYSSVSVAGNVAVRSYYSAHAYSGVGYLYAWGAAGYAYPYIGVRLLYDGDIDSIYIINDLTEHL